MRNMPRNRQTPQRVSKVPLIILMFVLIVALYMFISFMSSQKKASATPNAHMLYADESIDSNEDITSSDVDSEKDLSTNQTTSIEPENDMQTDNVTENDTKTGAGSENDTETDSEPESDSEPLTFSFINPYATEPSSQDDSGNNEVPLEPVEKDFRVYYINVGQGDSSLIICDGYSMLIDGGSSSQSDTIQRFLETRDLDHLDYIVATHPDEDHMGGLIGALNYATVGQVLSSVLSDDSESYLNFTKKIAERGLSVTVPSAGDVISLGSASVTVLGPINPGINDNNNSLVLRVVHGKNSFLFTGDAESAEQNDIIKSGRDIRSTVLLAGNHSNSLSNSEEWLKKVNPYAVVISSGQDNEYGYPTADVLDSLKKRDVKLYRTDIHGFLKVSEEEDGSLLYRVQRNAAADVFVPGPASGTKQ